MPYTRRDALRLLTAGSAAALTARRAAAAESKAIAPLRQITRGPKFHWFGYYDKLAFDPTNRYVLSNQVNFEHRSPRADDLIHIGVVDTADGDKWIKLGESSAWGWQQGCMLQWRPGARSEVVWNDREGDRFVCRRLDVQTQKLQTSPLPIYTISPDGRRAVTPDFARIQTMRPGYGYAGVADRWGDERAPKDSGIWRLDLETGEHELIVSLADVAKIPYRGKTLEGKWNWFNHLLFSPDGERIVFLHRWRDHKDGSPTSGFTTRMFTVNLQGGDLYMVDPSGFTSHFVWRDPQHLCAWTKPEGKPFGFYLLKDKTQEVTPVGPKVMTVNGHNTYLPIGDNRWILNDTYPDAKRQQTPYLYDVESGKRHDLARLDSPEEYQGEWRCDTHPRSSRDGRTIAIDSPHGGDGRQVWLIDVSKIVG